MQIETLLKLNCYRLQHLSRRVFDTLGIHGGSYRTGAGFTVISWLGNQSNLQNACEERVFNK